MKTKQNKTKQKNMLALWILKRASLLLNNVIFSFPWKTASRTKNGLPYMHVQLHQNLFRNRLGEHKCGNKMTYFSVKCIDRIGNIIINWQTLSIEPRMFSKYLTLQLMYFED